MKVWLLILEHYQETNVEGAYSTLEKAQAAYQKRYGDTPAVWAREVASPWSSEAYGLVPPSGFGSGTWVEIRALWLDDEVPA